MEEEAKPRMTDEENRLLPPTCNLTLNFVCSRSCKVVYVTCMPKGEVLIAILSPVRERLLSSALYVTDLRNL